MRRRVLLAGIYHETHTFVSDTTGLGAMRIRRGAEILGRRGDRSTLDAFLAVAERQDWEVVPTVDYAAMPSGTIEHVVFEQYLAEIEDFARAAVGIAPVDAVWLSLHGAMVTTREHDPEGALLARLRAIPGLAAVPVFGVFDLHATFTDAMARHADGLVAYRENPHTDAYDASERSAELLARALESGTRPRMFWQRLPIVWPPTGVGTADDPMRTLEQAARAIEASDSDIWAVNVVAGFAFADTADTGVSLSLLTSGSEAAAQAHLARLATIATEHRDAGLPDEWDIDAAIADAIGKGRLGKPCLIVEPADNIGGGSGGDCTTVLRAFLRHNLDAAAVVINDPEAVSALASTAIGARKVVAIGGKRALPDAGPLTLEVEVVTRSDGRFTLEDPNSHLAAMQGVHVDMGACVTVRARDTLILLTSHKTPPFDLGQLRTQGIVPEAMRFIAVKAAVAHRRAYDPITAASYTVATPGPCASNLTRLPWRHIRRPVFPLDPV